MAQITITDISGSTAYPISVYISDIYGNNQTLIGDISDEVPPIINYNTTIPPLFSTAEEVILKLIDNNGCEVFKVLPCFVISEILIITQNRHVIITQNGNSLILQTLPFSYVVSSGSLSCPLISTLTQTIYSPSPSWETAVRFFSDNQFDIPFNGGGLKYTNTLTCGYCWSIDSIGYTSNFITSC